MRVFICFAVSLIPCLGAAAHDGTSNVTATSTTSTNTMAAKTTTGSNRIGIVHCAWNSTSVTLDSVTWDGVSATVIATASEPSGADQRASLWRIVAPATASSSVVATFSGTTNSSCTASSYNGVDQTTPISNSNTANTSGTPVASPVTINCTSTSGDMVVDVVAFSQFDTVAPTVGAGQTQVGSQLYAGFWFELASYEAATGASTTMSWTFSGSGHSAQVCATLAQASAGPAAVTNKRIYVY